MKESSAALKRLEESYGPAFDYDIKSKSYVKNNRIYSLPFDYDKASDEKLIGLYMLIIRMRKPLITL